MFKHTVLSAAAIGMAVAFSVNTSHAATTWTCNIFTGPKHWINKGLKPWGKDVEKATKGEVKINYLPASAAPPPKQLNAISAGTFDCAFIFHAFTAKQAAGPQFGILPFLSEGDAAQGSVAYWRTWNKHFGDKNEFGKLGVKILSMFQFSGVHFFTATDQPIKAMSDLKRQKMWALAGTSSKTMKAAGIAHVSGPAARLGEFTQTKVIQGVAGITREGIVHFAGVNFPKSGTFTSKSIMMPSFAWMVDKKKWDALPGDLKKAIDSVSGENLARSVGVQSVKFENRAKAKLEKAGMVEHKAPAQFEADLLKFAQPQYDAWYARTKAMGVDGPAVVKEYSSIVKNLIN